MIEVRAHDLLYLPIAIDSKSIPTLHEIHLGQNITLGKLPPQQGGDTKPKSH